MPPPSSPATTAAPPSVAANVSREPAAFGRAFWFTYASNMSLSIAASLLYRYADFIRLLDGTEAWEFHLGLIVGVGMIGGLSMRIAQGVGMDTYGPQRVWLLSSALFSISCLGHLVVDHVDGPLIYLLRILFQISIAGFFGGSITFISGKAPVARMAEVVGNLGTSGFIGMALGSFLSDVILGAGKVSRGQTNQMFLVAAGLGATAWFFSLLAIWGTPTPVVRHRKRPLLRVLKRYSPWPILLIGAATGFGLGMPTIFLRPFLASLDLPGIALFFGVYTGTGFIARLSIRRLPEQLGIQRMIVIGMTILIASVLALLPVTGKWDLIVPAMLVGIAHAMLFPPVVAGGSAAFPLRYRGMGTTLVLAMFDVGNLVGSPTVGAILDIAGNLGWPKYPTMFTSVAVILAIITVIYYVGDRKTDRA